MFFPLLIIRQWFDCTIAKINKGFIR